MATLSIADLENLWVQAGGPEADKAVAAAIAEAESGGNPRTTGELNNDPSTGDYSVGPWQINYYGDLLKGRTAQYGPPQVVENDPLANARAAVSISSGGTDFNPWTTYTPIHGASGTGIYRGYLHAAQVAASAGGDSAGTAPSISDTPSTPFEQAALTSGTPAPAGTPPDNWAMFDTTLATSGLSNIEKALVALHALLNPPMASVKAPHVHWYDLIPLVGAVDATQQATKDATNIGEDIASVSALIFVRGMFALVGGAIFLYGMYTIFKKPVNAGISLGVGALTGTGGSAVSRIRRASQQADVRTARTTRQAESAQRAQGRFALAQQRAQSGTASRQYRDSLAAVRVQQGQRSVAVREASESRRQKEQELRLGPRSGKHFTSPRARHSAPTSSDEAA